MRPATSSVVVSARPRRRRRVGLAFIQVVLVVATGVVAYQSHSRSTQLGADRQVARPHRAAFGGAPADGGAIRWSVRSQRGGRGCGGQRLRGRHWEQSGGEISTRIGSAAHSRVQRTRPLRRRGRFRTKWWSWWRRRTPRGWCRSPGTWISVPTLATLVRWQSTWPAISTSPTSFL